MLAVPRCWRAAVLDGVVLVAASLADAAVYRALGLDP
jgi:hypothetical protein